MGNDFQQIETLKLLTRKQCTELLNFVWQNPGLVKSDLKIKHTLVSYENLFFAGAIEECDEEDFLSNLETFYSLHKQKVHILSPDHFNILIHRSVRIWKERDPSEAYERAKNCPQDNFCRSFIQEYEDSLPKTISHSQTRSIEVIENKNVLSGDGRRSLFKSSQEKEFFEAMREIYPRFIVYPNVALSTVIEFDNVKQGLSSAEKNYFFTGIIDCVVFTDDQSYMPKYFFELDSSYHDNPAQMKKDGYKNNILSAAGQKLYRIRKTGIYKKVDFAKLIKDLLKTDPHIE
jgi:hypothetical protein